MKVERRRRQGQVREVKWIDMGSNQDSVECALLLLESIYYPCVWSKVNDHHNMTPNAIVFGWLRLSVRLLVCPSV